MKISKSQQTLTELSYASMRMTVTAVNRSTLLPVNFSAFRLTTILQIYCGKFVLFLSNT